MIVDEDFLHNESWHPNAILTRMLSRLRTDNEISKGAWKRSSGVDQIIYIGLTWSFAGPCVKTIQPSASSFGLIWVVFQLACQSWRTIWQQNSTSVPSQPAGVGLCCGWVDHHASKHPFPLQPLALQDFHLASLQAAERWHKREVAASLERLRNPGSFVSQVRNKRVSWPGARWVLCYTGTGAVVQ